MTYTPLNLFAYVNDSENPIRRIPMSDDLQSEITSYFLELKDNFYNDEDKVDFDGNYNVDVGEIFRISDYPIPDIFPNAIQNPLQHNFLNLENEGNKIKFLFTGRWNNSIKYICFQSFDKRKLLARGIFAIINMRDTYKRLKEPGLILQDRLTVLFLDNELLFKSYHNTKRILDLSNYYREATDVELKNFASNPLFKISNIDNFKANADSIIRKKVALIQKNRILETATFEQVSTVASEYEIEFETNNNKIILPEDNKKLKELICFLDEDYFTAPITRRKCKTNSKKYMNES